MDMPQIRKVRACDSLRKFKLLAELKCKAEKLLDEHGPYIDKDTDATTAGVNLANWRWRAYYALEGIEEAPSIEEGQRLYKALEAAINDARKRNL